MNPQDYATKGTGKVKLSGKTLVGEGTAFTALAPGDKIRVGKAAEAYKLFDIVSDSLASIQNDLGVEFSQNEFSLL